MKATLRSHSRSRQDIGTAQRREVLAGTFQHRLRQFVFLGLAVCLGMYIKVETTLIVQTPIRHYTPSTTLPTKTLEKACSNDYPHSVSNRMRPVFSAPRDH